MPASEIVFILLLFLTFGGGVAYSVNKWDKKQIAAKRRKQGLLNAKRIEEDAELVCVECGSAVDPAVDVFHSRAWWCGECWKKIVH